MEASENNIKTQAICMRESHKSDVLSEGQRLGWWQGEGWW